MSPDEPQWNTCNYNVVAEIVRWFPGHKAEVKRDSFSIKIFIDTKGLIYLINAFQVWSFYQNNNITSDDFWCGFALRTLL